MDVFLLVLSWLTLFALLLLQLAAALLMLALLTSPLWLPWALSAVAAKHSRRRR